MTTLAEKLLRTRRWLYNHNIPIRLTFAVVAGIIISKLSMLYIHLMLHWSGLLPPLGTRIFDTKLLLLILVFHSLVAILSAYITAMLARSKARKAVFILGTKEAVLWLIGIVLLWKHSAPWFNLTKAIMGIPLALAGGKIYQWHVNKQRKRGNLNK
jgi:hypothetical protein